MKVSFNLVFWCFSVRLILFLHYNYFLINPPEHAWLFGSNFLVAAVCASNNNGVLQHLHQQEELGYHFHLTWQGRNEAARGHCLVCEWEAGIGVRDPTLGHWTNGKSVQWQGLIVSLDDLPASLGEPKGLGYIQKRSLAVSWLFQVRATPGILQAL